MSVAGRGGGRRLATLCAATLAWLLPMGASADAYDTHLDIGYDVDGTIPSPPHLNQLDIYAPAGTEEGGRLPVVVYVHDGGWRSGSRALGVEEEAGLFTERGWLFVSVSHRLSPDPVDPSFPSNRVKHPDHVRDVAEAVAWIERKIAAYGGDRRRILLVGAGSGAQIAALLATDPSYLQSRLMEPRQLIGAVGLAADAYDLPSALSQGVPALEEAIFNAFASPDEPSAARVWASASPLTHADPADPAMLLVAPAADPAAIATAGEMADALGREVADVVVTVDDDASGIVDALGGAVDPENVTASVLGFVDRALAANEPPRVEFKTRRKRVLRLRGKRKSVRVRFSFDATSLPGDGLDALQPRYLCRLGARVFRPCASPRRIRLGRGRHTFRVRTVAPNGAAGPISVAKVRVRR